MWPVSPLTHRPKSAHPDRHSSKTRPSFPLQEAKLWIEDLWRSTSLRLSSRTSNNLSLSRRSRLQGEQKNWRSRMPLQDSNHRHGKRSPIRQVLPSRERRRNSQRPLVEWKPLKSSKHTTATELIRSRSRLLKEPRYLLRTDSRWQRLTSASDWRSRTTARS